MRAKQGIDQDVGFCLLSLIDMVLGDSSCYQITDALDKHIGIFLLKVTKPHTPYKEHAVAQAMENYVAYYSSKNSSNISIDLS